MTYHSKIHIKVSKFNNKLSRPNFHPFWTPVNLQKVKICPIKFFFSCVIDSNHGMSLSESQKKRVAMVSQDKGGCKESGNTNQKKICWVNFEFSEIHRCPEGVEIFWYFVRAVGFKARRQHNNYHKCVLKVQASLKVIS